MDEPIPAALEEAIRAAPDDPSPYLVYADWLSERGHPRGELISLDHQLATDPSLEVIDERKRLIAAHPELVGPLEDFGLPIWKLGFVASLRAARGYYDDTDRERAIRRFRLMLDHPACRFLRQLYTGDLWIVGDDFDYGPVIESIRLPTLETLDLQANGPRLSMTSLGEPAGLFHACPKLASLALRAGSIRIGRVPALQRLVLESMGVDRRDLVELLDQVHPRLETLEIWIGSRSRSEVTIADLEPLLEGSRFPVLRRLGLMNSELGDDLCDAIVSSKIVRQLRQLDLSMGTVSDEGVRRLEEGKMSGLEVLDVSKNCISDAGIDVVIRLAKEVVHHSQKDPGDRFVSISD